MKNPNQAPNPLTSLLALVGPMAAFVLYLSVLGHPIDAPDLDFVSDDADAAATYPLDQIWLAPTPPQRPDLALYRPVFGSLLRLHYSLWPGKINLIRTSGLMIFVTAAFLFSVLAVRLLKSDGARVCAMLLFALHPMMTEANALLSAQGVLLALAAWMAALLVLQLHLTDRLSLAPAALFLGVLAFIAIGSHETAILLPFSLLAFDLLTDNREAGDATRSSRIFRWSRLGPALAVPILVWLGLRWAALGSGFFPDTTVRGLGEAPLPSRLLAAPGAIALGVFKLLAPLSPSFFHNPMYPGGSPPALLSLLVLIGLAMMIMASLLWDRRIALGLMLALVPLLGLIQIFPLTVYFAERILAFSVPGIAIALGAWIEHLTPLAGADRLSRPAKAVRVGVAVLFVILLGVTLRRLGQWGKPVAHWAAEARANPASPEPLTLELIALVSKPDSGLDDTAIRRASEDALRLAQGADADPVYQYLALYHLHTGNLPALRTLVEVVLNEDRPVRYGLFNSLGVAAGAMGLAELAERALLREAERWPNDFNNLFMLARILATRGQWEEALDRARRAADLAPSHMRIQSQIQFAEAALNVETAREEGVALLTRLSAEAPGLAQPYLILARHYDRMGDYAKVELAVHNALNLARDNMISYQEICAIQAESLKRQGKPEAAAQFLYGIASGRNLDLPLLVYTARFLLDLKFYDPSEKFYRTVLNSAPNDPASIYGLGRIAAERDGRLDVALNAMRHLLQVNPGNNEAATFLTQLETRIAAMEAQRAENPAPEKPASRPPLAPIPLD